MLLVSNRRLLDGFREGDPDALQTVYRHYAPRARGYLRAGFSFSSGGRPLRFRGYGSAYDLENAVQEVFLRALSPRARLGYDGLRPYGEYLMAIARHHVLNQLRRKEAMFVEEGEAYQVPQPAAEDLLEHREVDALLAAFVGGLDGRTAAYYRVRYVEGRNQSEAARELSINRIVARRVEARLKAALLDFMKAHGYLESVPQAIAGSLVPARR